MCFLVQQTTLVHNVNVIKLGLCQSTLIACQLRNLTLSANEGLLYQFVVFFSWRYNPLWVCVLQPSSGAIASSRTRFLDHTQRRATVGRTPLDK
jgi:hypothetical protein